MDLYTLVFTIIGAVVASAVAGMGYGAASLILLLAFPQGRLLTKLGDYSDDGKSISYRWKFYVSHEAFVIFMTLSVCMDTLVTQQGQWVAAVFLLLLVAVPYYLINIHIPYSQRHGEVSRSDEDSSPKNKSEMPDESMRNSEDGEELPTSVSKRQQTAVDPVDVVNSINQLIQIDSASEMVDVPTDKVKTVAKEELEKIVRSVCSDKEICNVSQLEKQLHLNCSISIGDMAGEVFELFIAKGANSQFYVVQKNTGVYGWAGSYVNYV